MGLPRKTRSKNKISKNKRSRKSYKGGVFYKTLRLAGRLAGCGPGGCFGNARLPLCTRILNLIELIGNNPAAGDPVRLVNFIEDTDYINSPNRCGRGEEYIAAYDVQGWRSVNRLIDSNVPLGSNHNMNYIRNFFRPAILFGGLAHRTTEEIQTAADINPPAVAAAAAAPVRIVLNTLPNSGELDLTGRNPPLANSIDFDDFVDGEEVIQIYTPTGIQIPDSVYRIHTLQANIDTDIAARRPVLDPLTRIPLTLANIRRLTIRIREPVAALPSPASRVRRRGSAAHLL